MKKAEKKELAEVLKSALHSADRKWDAEGPASAAYCYGYLIGVVKQAIAELENN